MAMVVWNGTVRALPFQEQLKAARIAGCSAIAVTPSDYNKWLGTSTSTADPQGMAAGEWEIEDAFGELCIRAAREGLRCDLEFIPILGVNNLSIAWDRKAKSPIAE